MLSKPNIVLDFLLRYWHGVVAFCLLMLCGIVVFSGYDQDPPILLRRSIKPKKISTEVVVMTPSPMHWRHRRDPINKAYNKQQWPFHQVQFLYIMGDRGGTQLELQLNTTNLNHEIDDYKYIQNLRYWVSTCRDFGDEESNSNGTSSTTCKIYQGLRYITQTYTNYKYVWRGSDDSYINLYFFFSTVAPELDRNSNPAIYMGHIRKNIHYDQDLNIQDGKPHLREVWHKSDFGDYMFGMGYMLSAPVVELVGNWEVEPLQTWCEDVVIGAWMRPFQIDWIHAPERGWIMDDKGKYNAKNCRQQLLIHYTKPEFWEKIDQKGNMEFCKWLT
jgi:hypothetical protein